MASAIGILLFRLRLPPVGVLFSPILILSPKRCVSFLLILSSCFINVLRSYLSHLLYMILMIIAISGIITPAMPQPYIKYRLIRHFRLYRLLFINILHKVLTICKMMMNLERIHKHLTRNSLYLIIQIIQVCQAIVKLIV